jgi:hypothetical protein
MFHYTNKTGFNGVRSQLVWLFKAMKPPCEHPLGAYFTDLDDRTHNLANRLRIPKEKTEYLFQFVDAGDLKAIPGARGRHIFYSSLDYPVEPGRQVRHGPSGLEGGAGT